MTCFIPDVRSYMAAPRRTSTVANDEIIAQALQEEFDTVAAVEAFDVAGAIGPVMEQLQAALLAQVYVEQFGTPAGSMSPAEKRVSTYVETGAETRYWDGGQSETVGVGSYSAEDEREGRERSLATSSDSCVYEVDEDDRQVALALSEDYPQVDQEVARRLHDLDSIPHVPKTNGEIPAVEAASDDHQRLLNRLSLYGLTERKIAGDGNCQFRALSDQLYRTPDHHKFVRKKVVAQLTELRESYEGYVPMEYDNYLKNMAKVGEWGDHVTLQAAADYVDLLSFRIALGSSGMPFVMIFVKRRQMLTALPNTILLFHSLQVFPGLESQIGRQADRDGERVQVNCSEYFRRRQSVEMEFLGRSLEVWCENLSDYVLQRYLLHRNYANTAEVLSRDLSKLLVGGSL